MKRFLLARAVDHSGVSGTGIVAEGVVWSDGEATLHWRSDTPSTDTFHSLADLEKVHGHNGSTQVVFVGDPPSSAESASHAETPVDDLQTRPETRQTRPERRE